MEQAVAAAPVPTLVPAPQDTELAAEGAVMAEEESSQVNTTL